MSKAQKLTVRCKQCGRDNVFDQPYPYHAGFGNQGFLYNDAGTLTLTWSSYDPAYVAIVGQKHPWALTAADRERLEQRLRDAPSGGRWGFNNPARCVYCAAAISEPMLQTIYYLRYPGSVETEEGREARLKEFLNDA